MSTTNIKRKKDSLLLYLAIAFIAGFISGAAFAVFKISPTSTGDVAHNHPTEQNSGISDQQKQAIANLEKEVTSNPERFQSWTRLGNLYYDTGQYEKAVAAYEKSLELHTGDGNIWTDLGVMYRRTQRPQKAIEAFNKAVEVEPTHEIARLNKGIVLMYDLNDQEGAIQAWEELLRLNPEAKTVNGDSIRDFVEQVKNSLANQKQ